MVRTEVPKEFKVPLGDLDIYYSSSSFLKYYGKMADVDIDPFGDHDKTDSHPDEGEAIALNPGGGAMGGSTWEPEHKQETSFRGLKLKREG